MRHLLLIALIAVASTGCAGLKRFEQRARRVAEKFTSVDVTPLKTQADQWAQPAVQQQTNQTTNCMVFPGGVDGYGIQRPSRVVCR